jgi:hypothetical protein
MKHWQKFVVTYFYFKGKRDDWRRGGCTPVSSMWSSTEKCVNHPLTYKRLVHYISFPPSLQQFTGEELLEFYFVYQPVISSIVSMSYFSVPFSSLLLDSPVPSVCYVICSVLIVVHKDSHPFTTTGRPKSSWRSL